MILSSDNITGVIGLSPSMHAAVYTPSSRMSDILKMRFFHLVLRGGASSKAGFREQVLYLGVYRAFDAESPLPPKRFSSLDAEVCSHTCSLLLIF